MFGLKSELRIIYKDGKEVFIKNRLEGASQLPSDAPFEFSRKWMEGVLYPLDELKVAEVTCHSPDPKNNFVMSGDELVKIFNGIVPYGKGYELEEMRDVQYMHLYYSLAETFILAISIATFALNLYHCRHAIKENLERLWRKFYKS